MPEPGYRPRFVFAGSTAAFGGPLPDPVDDRVAQAPQTSYGTGKSIAELLINDYSRHGFIDGRALRVPIVLMRPETVGGSVADVIGALLREPLFGRDVICPLNPGTRIPVASVRKVAKALIRLHEIPEDRFGYTRAMNMPALTVSIREIAEAAASVDFPGRRGEVIWEQNDEVQGLIESWPRAVVAEEALRHGLETDESIAEILRAFIEDYEMPPSLRLASGAFGERRRRENAPPFPAPRRRCRAAVPADMPFDGKPRRASAARA